MKNLDLIKVTNAVEKMCMDANFYLGSDVLDIKKIKFLCARILVW